MSLSTIYALILDSWWPISTIIGEIHHPLQKEFAIMPHSLRSRINSNFVKFQKLRTGA